MGGANIAVASSEFRLVLFSVEYIIPKAAGGSGADSNLAFACQGCNNHKYISTEATDPATGGFTPLFNPRAEPWPAHFRWSEDTTRIVGQMPTGRATVAKLQLNREPLVNLRRLLVHAGQHPPSDVS